MKLSYMIILWATYNNENPDKKAMYAATTASLAIAGVHRYMGQYMCADGIESVTCMAINNAGEVIKNESWYADPSEG